MSSGSSRWRASKSPLAWIADEEPNKPFNPIARKTRSGLTAALCSMNPDHMKSIVAALEERGNPFEAAEISWLVKLEENFGHPLPPMFRELISNFIFPEFDLAEVTLFSNLNDESDSDITVAPFADAFMSPWLRSHRFLQFGRPNTGSYDPVCFDLTAQSHDPPVIVLYHEDILMERKYVYTEQIAPSFMALVDAELHNKRLQPIARKTRSG
jgi:hypothetical protein